jgi:hypothetical protein
MEKTREEERREIESISDGGGVDCGMSAEAAPKETSGGGCEPSGFDFD